MAGAISEMINKSLAAQYPKLATSETSVRLVNHELLGAFFAARAERTVFLGVTVVQSSTSSTARSANPNSAPPPGRVSAQIRPPIASMRRAHTNRPMPEPLTCRANVGDR